MTVRELIIELLKFNVDAQVDLDGGCGAAKCVEWEAPPDGRPYTEGTVTIVGTEP